VLRGRKVAGALAGEEQGFTLIELLIAASVGLVVVGGALTMFVGALHSEPRATSKVAAIQQARTTVDRITRELRQGIETKTTSPSQLAIVTYVKAATCGGAAASTSIPCRVTYACSTGKCSRFVAQPDGTAPGPTAQVISGLSTSNVFSYQYLPGATKPTYVGVSFSLSSDGRPVTLTDGVALRNPSEES
jgi:prepilin-type N-terminal cleavage/methylation domain-containing protein